MKWAEHAPHMGEKRMHAGFCGKARRKNITKKI
jgi:hypothetical protein